MKSDIAVRAETGSNRYGYDDLDRRLVHALQLNGRAPFSLIASVLGVSDQTVARRFARLRNRGSVRVLGLREPERTGEVRWHVRVQCQPGSAQTIAESLARREGTSWVALLSGGAEIHCSTRADRETPHDDLLLQLLRRTPSVIGVSAQCVM